MDGDADWDHPLFTELEELHILRDRPTGLVAVVAIHDRTLGPARGGTRLRRYPSLHDGARDAARLARAMSHKFAVHGLAFGGGKAVLLQDEAGARDRDLLEARLEAYGRFLERLGGHFGTGPDYGIGEAEARVIRRATGHVVGVHSHAIASEATAAGVRVALEEGLDRALGGGLAERRVAVQGVGAVGGALARQLAARGARLLLADADPARAATLAAELGAEQVDPADILRAEVDALAPCATGDVLDAETIATLRCRVVAGAANDQLRLPEADQAAALAAREILYLPDFVANGGGAVLLTGCNAEAPQDADVEATAAHVRRTARAVLARAEADGATPYAAAVAIAQELIARGPAETASA